MRNGNAKSWITAMVAKLIKDHPELENIQSQEPSQENSIINAVEYLSATSEASTLVETFWNKPIDDMESVTSVSESGTEVVDVEDDTSNISIRKHRPVPDFITYLRSYPGMFPLVVEIRPSKQDGTEQNLERMLSKLFYQDAVLGLMVTPVKFVMSGIIKRKDELLFIKTDVFIQLTEEVDSEDHLDLYSLHVLHRYVYSVLLWGTKTQCKFN